MSKNHLIHNFLRNGRRVNFLNCNLAACLYPGKDFREQSDSNWEYADGFKLLGPILDPKFRKVPFYHPKLSFHTLTEAQEACRTEHREVCTGITREGKDGVQIKN